MAEFDMKHICLPGMKHYAFCVIDAAAREAAVHIGRSRSGRNARTALEKAVSRFGKNIVIVCDNGSENIKEAEEYPGEQGITQYRARPHAPKEKPCVERFIGTLQKECPDYHWFLDAGSILCRCRFIHSSYGSVLFVLITDIQLDRNRGCDILKNMSDLTNQPVAVAVEQQRFITKVYCWMAGALAVTALTAFIAASSITFMRFILTTRFAFWGLLIAEFGLVIWLSAGIRKMKATTAIFAFLVYSIVNGLTLSVIFYAYTPGSIVLAFVLSAVTFGGMSVYGLVTKNDLTKTGSYLMMALLGLIIASAVNLFLNSDAFTWIVSMATVIIFTGLTAYDNWKLKRIVVAEGNSEIYTKQAIFGALNLYLDFINIFLALLRLFGKKN